jgi:hypothetical protein
MYECKKCERTFKHIGLLKRHCESKIPCDEKVICLNSNCNNEVKYPNKYCSSSCAAKTNNLGRKLSKETRKKISISNGGKGNIREKRKCFNCGNIVFNKFCNGKCQAEYEESIKIEKWLNGKLNGNSACGHSSYVKRYLRKKYDNKCSKCGWGEINPFSKNIPLEVEHIDGNPYNNNPDNVDLLCPNCHSLTKTYRGANVGNGRRSYLKKYYISTYKKSL